MESARRGAVPAPFPVAMDAGSACYTTVQLVTRAAGSGCQQQ